MLRKVKDAIILTMWRAQSEWISCKARRTGTNWIMIFGGTLRS